MTPVPPSTAIWVFHAWCQIRTTGNIKVRQPLTNTERKPSSVLGRLAHVLVGAQPPRMVIAAEAAKLVRTFAARRQATVRLAISGFDKIKYHAEGLMLGGKSTNLAFSTES